MWADTLLGVSIHTRQGFVFVSPDGRQHDPICVVEFMKRRGKGNRWLKDACADYSVEITALDLNPGENILKATFTPRDTKPAPFHLQLPFVLGTHLRNGVPGRMAVRSFPTAG